jgi:hypothetical protein
LRPDYPAKIFADKRNSYVLLMESLAADDTAGGAGNPGRPAGNPTDEI